jgi:hypothetical protein
MARTRKVAVAAAAVALLGAVPAGATVVEQGRYTDEPYEFSYDDCGFDVAVEGSSSGQFRIRQGKGKTDSAFFLHDNFSFTETHTNPATGEFFTITANAVYNEVKARRVEGNVFEFESVEAGQFRFYDSAGRLVARERGNIHHRILFDTGGDDIPGGVEVADLGESVHGPHVEDFCGLITPLIGP